jgi:hypothetical protein
MATINDIQLLSAGGVFQLMKDGAKRPPQTFTLQSSFFISPPPADPDQGDKMITFNRSQVIGAEFPDDETIRFNGIQVDHIYSMEIDMEVRIADGEILAIEGRMKRYTNFVCPHALPVLQNAVGMSLRDEGWDRQIMKEIGRKGCEHFAEIIIECGRSLDQACMSKSMWQALEKDPELDQAAFLEKWIKNQD